MTIFRSFRSTVTPFLSRQWPKNLKLLVDPVTGSPTGIESVNANGPDGIWAPVDLTAAQIVSPSAAMIADVNAAYRLNVAPYTRYFSDGTNLNTTSSAPVGLFNVNAATLPNWRKVVASARAGTGRGTLLLVGDSTTAGAGAGTGGTNNFNAAFARNYPRDLAQILSGSATGTGKGGAGIPVSDNAFFGNQAVTIASYSVYDPRVTLGAHFTMTGNASLGGPSFLFTTGGGNGLLSFTPVSNFDSFTVYYAKSGTATATVDVDGGASLGTISTAGATTVASQNFTTTLGAHTININPQNNGNVTIMGVKAWNSAVPAIDIVQCGRFGSNGFYYVATGNLVPLTPVPVIAPDLTVFCLTINDSNANTDLGLYQSEMQTIITALKATGDVLLVVGAPSNTTQATDGTLDTYISVLRSLALSNGCGIVDLKARWTSYAVTNPILPYADNIHPGPLGYWDEAQAIAQALVQ